MALTPEQAAKNHPAICEMVAEGKTIRQIASHFGVSPGSIIAWATLTPELTEQYARARESAADMFETEIIEAALAVSPDTAAADRVKIDAMKWVAARRSPKKYGDRTTNELVGANGGPIQVQQATELTDDQLAAIAANINKSG